MAFPAGFDEANGILDKPLGMNYDECECLSVLRANYGNGTPVVISCWKLTLEEMAEVQRTGRVWLAIYGVTMPPAIVHGVKPF